MQLFEQMSSNAVYHIEKCWCNCLVNLFLQLFIRAKYLFFQLLIFIKIFIKFILIEARDNPAYNILPPFTGNNTEILLHIFPHFQPFI